MFGGKKNTVEPVNFERVDTLVGKDTIFTGNIAATGAIRIDGEFSGDIKVKGDLVIGEVAKVEATVEARNVLVAGYLRGNIQASGKVDLAPNAHLFGDITVGKLIIEEGARFEGNCIMNKTAEGNSDTPEG